MKLAVIDLGSNSARLGIYEKRDKIEEIFRLRINTRLAEGLKESNTLKTEPMERTLSALVLFKEKIAENKADKTIAVATEGLRRAENSDYFISLVKEKTGIEIEIINGKKEAYLGFRAAKSITEEKNFYIMDIGGGSFELTLAENGKNTEFVCLPYGAVVLKEEFEPDLNGLEGINNYLSKVFDKIGFVKSPYPVIVMGGSVKELLKILKKGKDYYSKEEIFDAFNEIYNTPVTEREEKFSMEKRRCDIIISGLAPFIAFLNKSQTNKIIFCEKSIRDAIAEVFFDC